MSRVAKAILLVAALVWAGEALAQKPSRSSAPSRSAPPASSQSKQQARPPQSQASPADQLEACRQHVTQLDEQLRARQKKLVSLRNERKTVGLSGGEVAKFKLSSLDQEIRELSRQSEQLIAQIDSEGARCEQLAANVKNRAVSPPPPQQQRPAKPPTKRRNRE
jgi:chromosome segregation ATPase